jgi:hypothetical protein
MDEPTAKFREPFRAVSREMREALQASKEAMERGQVIGEAWPTLKEEINTGVLPTFKSWIQQLREVIQPKQLKSLQKHKRQLERLAGRTWWHPSGLRLRLRVTFFGVLMGLVILLLLVFGVAAVVGMVYLVSLILN